MIIQRLKVSAAASGLFALRLFGLMLNSRLALGHLARHYVRHGMDEQAAAEVVAAQRAGVRRRAITCCFVLIALGVILNNFPRRSIAHQIAAVLIYTGLFLLTSQFSNKWLLRPGDLKKYITGR